MAVGHHSWAIVQVRISVLPCRVPQKRHFANRGSKLTYHNAKGNDTSNITNRQLRHLVYLPSNGTLFLVILGLYRTSLKLHDEQGEGGCPYVSSNGPPFLLGLQDNPPRLNPGTCATRLTGQTWLQSSSTVSNLVKP